MEFLNNVWSGFWNVSDEFRFVSGDLPLTTKEVAVGTVVGYVFLIKFLQWFMRDKQPVKFVGVLKFLTLIHNWALCFTSLFMFLGISYFAFENFRSDGAEAMFCDANKRGNRGPLIAFYYIFYYTKYWELIDSVILALKKKPIIFLHIYHHFITLVLTFVMLYDEVAVQWACIVTNCFVHIWMYAYYAMRAHDTPTMHKICGQYKVAITSSQITQFFIDVGAIGYGFFLYWQHDFVGCSGHLYSWIFGAFVIVSFLVLFLNFFDKQYTQPGQKKKAPAPAKSTPKKSQKAD